MMTALPERRHRRSPKEKIADLEAQIAKIKERAERQKLTKDPTLRHISAAVRSIDKALTQSKDKATGNALVEARSTLVACLALSGANVGDMGKSRARGSAHAAVDIDPAKVVSYVQDHPGCKCQDIAASMEADTKSVSPVLKGLKEEGKLRSKGQARGMRYYPGK